MASSKKKREFPSKPKSVKSQLKTQKRITKNYKVIKNLEKNLDI
jgi:hypothetical protein